MHLHLDLLRVLPGHRRGGRRRRGVLHVLPVLGDAHAAVLHALPSAAAAAVGAAGDERGDHGDVARGRHCRRRRRRPAFHHPGQPQPQAAAAAAVPPSLPRPPSPDPDLMGRAAVTQAEGSEEEEEEEGMERGHGANIATRLPSLPLTAAHTSQFSAHHARTHCWVKDCFLPSFLSSSGFLPPPRLFLYPPSHSHSRTLRKPIALALNVPSFASRDDLELVWHLP